MKYKLEIADKKGHLIAKVDAYSYEVLETILQALKEKGLVKEE